MSALAVVYSKFDLRVMVMTLIVCVFLAVAAIFADWLLLTGQFPIEVQLDPIEKSQLEVAKIDSLADYEAAFEQSQVFGTFRAQTNLTVLRTSIEELTKDLRLKGVVIMDEPEAILLDARTNKSNFIRVGDKLGDVTVESISEGLLVLNYFGEKKELRVQ